MSAVLQSIGLTRQRVERLTKDYRPPMTPCPQGKDVGQFIFEYLSEWGSARSTVINALIGTRRAMCSIVKWNEANPDKQILVESINLDGDITFYYTEESK